MITLKLFTGVCITILILCFFYMVDIYPIHNKQTKKIEWWITWWSRTEERYVKFKLFERKFKE